MIVKYAHYLTLASHHFVVKKGHKPLHHQENSSKEIVKPVWLNEKTQYNKSISTLSCTRYII